MTNRAIIYILKIGGYDEMSNIKRLFFYFMSLVTLGIFAGGVGTVLSLCFEFIRGDTWGSYDRIQLSLGLAMLIAGSVLWFLFWRATQRQVAENPAEIGTEIRKLYLNIILGVTAITGLNAAAGLIQWLVFGVPLSHFPSVLLAMLIVCGGIWYYHWRLEEREGQPSPAAKTLRRWYVYVLSGFGLVSLTVGLILFINNAILSLPVWGREMVSVEFWNSDTRSYLSLTLIGGLAWWFHWFRMAKGDYESTLRQVYLYLLAIGGGVVTCLVALTTFLYEIFRFTFGVSVAADIHFTFLGWTVPTIIIAAAIWFYHRKVVQEEAARLPEQRLSARRVYLYLMSFIGLGTLIGGLAVLLGILVDLIIQAAGATDRVSAGWWHSDLSLCLALLLVGVPIFLYYWRRVLRMTAEGGTEERAATSRRIYLYTVLGIAILTLATDLVMIVYELISGLLQGMTGASFLESLRWSLQTLLIPVPLLLYHRRTLRQDQSLGAEKVSVRKTVSLLAGEAAAELVPALEERLGYHIRLLRHVSEIPEDISTLSEEGIEALVEEIQAAPSSKVILIITGGRVTVLPYQEK
ncbi:DUF5671 domain-containing protein [Chloroflexota bacterium]